MSGPNLSEWALGHRSLVVFLMLVCAVAGVLSYTALGRSEDPPFTVKTMVVKVLWPGATTSETINLVTDRIEKKLEETPSLDFLRSYTKPGEAVIFVNLKDTTPPKQVSDIWYQVRKKVQDVSASLPAGVQGPFFNDEFGDTYSVIYAFTAEGFSYRELKDYVDKVRAHLLRVPDVSKVDFIGVQDEKIYIEFSTRTVASLGINPGEVVRSLQAQNNVAPAGLVTTDQERILLFVSGAFGNEGDVRAVNIRTSSGFIRLGDISSVTRGYADPPSAMFRFNGMPAIALAVAMNQSGDVLQLGKNLARTMATIENNLPLGIDVHLVADQPVVVDHAIAGFTRALFEAIAIVLAVSFISLGLRAGLVVAISIPLVLGITFATMEFLGIALQRVSLGALIISLGLLVDDAMITVEMMIAKLEEGMDRLKAAAFAYTSTAFPMLTGTLVTVAGFLPVGFAKSSAGEYSNSLFWVVAIALIASWFVAVLFAPLLGVWLLPRNLAERRSAHGPSRIESRVRTGLIAALRHRWIVIGGTAAVFALALVGARELQQQFFPQSDRTELLVSLTLRQSASIETTRQTVDRFETLLRGDDDVARWSFYVGSGAVRFYLPMDVQLANDFFAQAVVVAKDVAARERLQAKLATAFATGYDDLIGRVNPLEMGPPVGWPIKYRVSGDDAARVRAIAYDVANAIGADPSARDVNLDWSEPVKVIRLNIDQDVARLVGVTSESLARAVRTVVSGYTVTQVRDATYLIDVVGRSETKERQTLGTLRALQVMLDNGRAVPLAQVATLEYTDEYPMIWRRKRQPTVTVQGDTAPGVQSATVVSRLDPAIAAIRAKLPDGYAIEVGGTVEESAKGGRSLAAVVPVMLMAILTILMVQLQSFQRLILVISVAPLGLIGVVAAMLPTGTPMGFIATLGVIALIGMIVRNSVILIDQIETNIAAGHDAWTSIIEATLHRLRPILLTAAAAILGMLPIAREVFWGPMAYAVIGGLAIATVLTLIFLPALYAAWFRVREPKPPDSPPVTVNA
jgi:multidrug efflux pump subunit AcrB